MKRIIPLVLALIVLGVGVYFLKSVEREEGRNMAEVYRRTEPLQRQKDELLVQKQELSDNFKIEIRDVSTVQVLFTESNVKLFTDVYPLMRERGITGVIGMSMEDFPGVGVSSRIKADQYDRLLMDGWGSCLVYDGRFKLETYLFSMKDILFYRNIEMPTTIYFTEKYTGYDPETMDELLAQFGVNTIVCKASDGRSGTVAKVEDLWKIGAMPWNYTGILADLEELAVTDGGNLTLTASFDNIWDGLMTEAAYDSYGRKTEQEVQEAFIDFLDMLAILAGNSSPTVSPSPVPVLLGDDEIEPQLTVTEFVSARAGHLRTQASMENQMAEYRQMQADLDEQIAALEKQIDDIYIAYNVKNAQTTNAKKATSGETA